MKVHRPLLLVLVLASSAQAQGAPPAPATRPITLSPAEKAAAAAITPAALRAHIRFLPDDLLEGRGPATRGDRLAQVYIGYGIVAPALPAWRPGDEFEAARKKALADAH